MLLCLSRTLHLGCKKKLQHLGATTPEIEEVVDFLKKEQFLNERRFTEIYVKSYLRQKKWGKLKIRYALKQKQISESFIDEALKCIKEEEYLEIIENILQNKQKQWTALEWESQKIKLYNFFLSKGFESQLILKCLKDFKNRILLPK